MEQGPSWEAAGRSVGQEFPLFLWNPEIRYRVRNRPQLGSYLDLAESSSHLYIIFL
jgi:hypothetical protein